MKKLVPIGVIVLFFLITVSLGCKCEAENIDLSSIDYPSLRELKERVDREYFSRPETGLTLLTVGAYECGTDFLPGAYYIGISEPTEDYSAMIFLYKNIKDYQNGSDYGRLSYVLGNPPERIIFEKGNVLQIYSGSACISVSPFSSGEGYNYEPPAGTLVPVGTYTVGDDIPAAQYTAYSKTVNGGKINVYPSLESHQWASMYSEVVEEGDYLDYEITTLSPAAITLVEGNIVEIEKDIIMIKKEKVQLSF